jgi:hypothetical protein
MKKFLLLPTLLFIFLFGCSKEDEMPDPQIKRENTIEYTVESKMLPDKTVLLETKRIIYVNSKVFKTESIFDTLPFIGTENIKVLDENEEETSQDTTVTKDYDIYFTIKSKKQ